MKPKPPLFPAAVFLLLAGTGYLATAKLLKRPVDSLLAAAAPAGEKGHPIRTARELTVADCLALVDRAGDRPGSGKSPVEQKLADWTDDEIRRALNAAIQGPDIVLPESVNGKAIAALVAEWLRRDASAFTKWLDALPSEVGRFNLARYALLAWPEGKVEQGLAYFLAHPALGEGGNRRLLGWLASRTLGEVAKHGVQALADTLEACKSADLQGQSFNFPPGFDYRAFSATGPGREMWKEGRSTLIVSAMIRDNRDTAFDVMTQVSRGIPRNYNYPELQLVHAYIPPEVRGAASSPEAAKQAQLEKDREQATWLGGKLGALSEEERMRLIPNMILNLRDAEQLDNFISALPTAESKAAANKQAATQIQLIGFEQVLPHLEAMGSPAERISWLEEMPVVTNSTSMKGLAPEVSLSTSLLTSKLTEWGASAEQISRIVERVQVKSGDSGN